MTRIEKLCVDKGLRMTEQRRVIARVLSDAADHPDVLAMLGGNPDLPLQADDLALAALLGDRRDPIELLHFLGAGKTIRIRSSRSAT